MRVLFPNNTQCAIAIRAEDQFADRIEGGAIAPATNRNGRNVGAAIRIHHDKDIISASRKETPRFGIERQSVRLLARGHVKMRFDFVAFSVDFYDVMIFSAVHKERTFAVGETSLQTGTDVYRRNRGVRFWIDDGE